MCLSKTIEQRTIDYKTSDLFIGRVGVMAGFNCPNDRGTAYVRVSGLRDFRGDIDGTFSANGNEYKVDMDLDQNRASRRPRPSGRGVRQRKKTSGEGAPKVGKVLRRKRRTPPRGNAPNFYAL